MANQGAPPAAIIPKTSKKLKLLDIEPLELARQLTIMESILYQRIRPMECLQRAREQKTENIDNIAIVIQTSNRVCANHPIPAHPLIVILDRSPFGSQSQS